LAAWAYRAGLSPNQVTGISAAFTFSGIALLALMPQTTLTGVAVALALVIGYAFDSADGQVARLRGGGSPAGEWLDHIVDSVKTSALPLAVLVSFYRAGSVSEPWLLVPLAAAIVYAVYFFAMILTEQLRRQQGTASRASDAPRNSLVRSLLVIPTDYGVLCLTFLLLGAPIVFAAVFTLIAAATAGYTLLASVKWFREITALSQAAH
jgi:phosphatidylglycerophosphate synthase